MRWQVAPSAFRLGVLATALTPAVLAAYLSRLVAPDLPWWPFIFAGIVVGLAGLWVDRWAARKVWPGPFPRLRDVLFTPASALWALAWSLDEWRERRAWPRSVDQAVEELLRRLDRASREVLRSAGDEGAVEFHFSLGMAVRNSFGLWAGNQALLEDCGHNCPDVASGVIVGRLIQRLRETGSE